MIKNARRNLHGDLSARVFLRITASGLSGSRACGDNCAGDPDISRGVTMRWTMPARSVAAETLPVGGDRQHELRPSPAGRSPISTARTPFDRCRRPPHRPNHHRAGAAMGCAAIPYVAPQRSPRGRRVSRAAAKRTTGAVDSRKPTIEPPTWPTFLPPPFTSRAQPWHALDTVETQPCG